MPVLVAEHYIDKIVFPPPPVGDGGVLYLPGLPGGGSKIYDRSPYGRACTIIGATWLRLPSGLWCLDFHGTDDMVTIPNFAFLDLDTDFTIKMWAKFDKVDSSQCLMAHQDQAGDWQWLFYISSAGNVIKFVHSSNGTSWNLTGVAGSRAKVVNTWYCVAITRRGPVYQIHEDGLLDGNPTTEATAHFATDVDGVIGAVPNGAIDLDGKIALPKMLQGAKSPLGLQNITNREKHLFGVW